MNATNVRFDVSGEVPGLNGQTALIVGGVHLGQGERGEGAGRVLFVLLHGGTYDRSYWDRVVPGEPRDAYSCAAYLVGRGHVVAAFDTLGVGESACSLNGFELTPDLLAAAAAVAVRRVREGLESGTLLPEGQQVTVELVVLVGHSMGGITASIAQARHRCADAVVLQGAPNLPTALPGVDPSEMSKLFAFDEHGYTATPRQLLWTFFHGEGALRPPQHVIEADDLRAVPMHQAQVARLFAPPPLLAEESKAIDVPVLLTFGQMDPALDPLGDLRFYEASPSRTVFIHRGAGHCGNLAPTRENLWRCLDRFAQWATFLKQAGLPVGEYRAPSGVWSAAS